MEEKKLAVLSLSGGMDSSTLLIHLLAKGYKVKAISFNYGQKHVVELDKARQLVEFLQSKGLDVDHHMVNLITLAPLLNSALVRGGKEVPEGHYENENMKATVVPNRNKIFSSIIQSVALSIATAQGPKNPREVQIAMGIHAGDHDIYPDCRQEFRDLDYEAFLQGNWDSSLVKMYTPYLDTDKLGILQDGLLACDALNIEFDDVYKHTMTSYKPIYLPETGLPPGTVARVFCHSDYKSASSVERVEAFIKLGRKDPISYANQDGIVTWEKVVESVKKVLKENN